MHVDLYPPLNTLKPVADNIWIVDSEQIKLMGVPFSTRMTVVRLENGDLFIHSPTPLTTMLKREIDVLGPVRHLVSPNFIHYWWIGAWHRHYPAAIRWASPKVRPRAAKHDIEFDRDLGESAEPAWQDEIDQLIIRGSRAMQEVAFFHKPSKTLILTDMIENFELSHLHPAWWRWLIRFAGITDPDGKTPIDLYWSFLGHRDQLKTAIETMIDWKPERVILAHGRWYQKDGVRELRRAFRRLGEFR